MSLKELTNEAFDAIHGIVVNNLIEKYGETINFFILDRLPIDTFTKLASLKQDNIPEMYAVMETLILNEVGIPIMSEEKILPVDILTECILKVSEFLGKSVG